MPTTTRGVRLGWTGLALGSALLWGNPKGLLLLAPVLLGLWFLRPWPTHVAGAAIVAVHVAMAVVIASADSPSENRAFASLTAGVIDLGVIFAVGISSAVLRGRKAPGGPEQRSAARPMTPGRSRR